MYCALNLDQNQSGEILMSGGPGLPEPGVCFPADSKDNILQPPATFGVFPGEKKSGNFRGPPGVFTGGWHIDDTQPGPREDPSPPSNPTPSNLTPGESQQDSSATSYSPRLEDDRKTRQFVNSISPTGYGAFPGSQESMYIGHSSSTSNRDDSSNTSFPAPRDQHSNTEAYDFPPSNWDFGSGTTPLPSGMSPPADGHWSNTSVPPLPAWSSHSSTEDKGNVNWKANQRDSPKYGYKSGFLMDTSVPSLNGKDPFQIDFYHDTETVNQDQRR